MNGLSAPARPSFLDGSTLAADAATARCLQSTFGRVVTSIDIDTSSTVRACASGRILRQVAMQNVKKHLCCVLQLAEASQQPPPGLYTAHGLLGAAALALRCAGQGPKRMLTSCAAARSEPALSSACKQRSAHTAALLLEGVIHKRHTTGKGIFCYARLVVHAQLHPRLAWSDCNAMAYRQQDRKCDLRNTGCAL